MRWTALLVPVVAASCATADDGAGRIGDPVASDPDGAPPGERVEHVEALDLSLAVPEDWITVDPGLLDEATDRSDAIDELAERLGVDADTVTDLVDDTVALVVVAPTDAPAPANLSVIELPVPGGLPPRAMLEAGMVAAGAEVLDVEAVERDDLAIVEIRYRMVVGDQTFEGVSAFVEVDDVGVSLTVSSTDRAEADRVGDLVVATLESTG